jgi:RNA polymerase sigma factor (sigma-70 family)
MHQGEQVSVVGEASPSAVLLREDAGDWDVASSDPDDDFAQRYRGLFDAAMRMAYRMTRDAAVAEDVAAEAMARAYARWRSVRTMPQPEAWVVRVAVNLIVDAARHKNVVQRALPSLWSSTSSTTSFDDDIAVRRALIVALRSLPRRQRDVIALRYLAEMDEDSIANFLGIAQSSVRTHAQRGLASLRLRLGGREGEQL